MPDRSDAAADGSVSWTSRRMPHARWFTRPMGSARTRASATPSPTPSGSSSPQRSPTRRRS